jgi:hypothetical protein
LLYGAIPVGLAAARPGGGASRANFYCHRRR